MISFPGENHHVFLRQYCVDYDENHARTIDKLIPTFYPEYTLKENFMNFELPDRTNYSCYSCYMTSLYYRRKGYKEIVWSKIFCPERVMPKNKDFQYKVLPLESFEQDVTKAVKRAAEEYTTEANKGGAICYPSFGLFQSMVESEYVQKK